MQHKLCSVANDGAAEATVASQVLYKYLVNSHTMESSSRFVYALFFLLLRSRATPMHRVYCYRGPFAFVITVFINLLVV